ncbi:MAG TPA: caspase family protein, partial [Planctomycetota bacterium]|nr:caspase family protein [Planctomycetota bacterium]
PLAPHELAADPVAQRRAVAADGRELRADLVLLPRVKVHEVAYVGMTGWWAPSAVACAALWFPTFWFPDEAWSASATLEVELLSARTGKVIYGPSEFPAREEASFDDFERGWDLWAVWGIPLLTSTSWFGVQESNLQAVEAELMPRTIAASERALLKDVTAYLGRVPVKLEATEPQTIALVVGIDRHESAAIPPLECAENDARAIEKFLRSPQGGALGDRSLRALVGRDATRAAIREFLDVDLARTAPADRVVVYFAGYGAVKAPARFLVAADTDPARLEETAISMDDVAAALDRAPAEKVLLILDTSWGGDIAGRTLPAARPAAGEAVDPRFLERLMTRPGRFVVTAADLGGTAQEYVPERHGVFTMILEQGLREKGATKGAGSRVSLLEIVEYLRERVPPSSSLIGERQDVRLYGDRSAAGAVTIIQGGEAGSVPAGLPGGKDRRP